MTSTSAPARCIGGPSALLIRILIRSSLFDVFLILLVRQISFFDPLKRFIRVAQASLKLSRLDCLEDLAKFRARLKTEGDQIITPQQRRRNDRFVSEFFTSTQQKFVIVQHAMTAFAINPVQLQLLVERWSRHEPVSYTHLRAHETPEHLVCCL